MTIRTDWYKVSTGVYDSDADRFMKWFKVMHMNNARHTVNLFEVVFANYAAVTLFSEASNSGCRIAFDFFTKNLGNALALFVDWGVRALPHHINCGGYWFFNPDKVI